MRENKGPKNNREITVQVKKVNESDKKQADGVIDEGTVSAEGISFDDFDN